MRLAWLTDLHLDFVTAAAFSELVAEVRDTMPEALLVGGDTAEASGVLDRLCAFRDQLGVPVYFVLGNHDYYGSSLADVRRAVRETVSRERGLVWLSESSWVPLTARTALVGHDGWGDGGFGNALGTRVSLNDFLLIRELRCRARQELLRRLAVLGEEAAEHLAAELPAALRERQNLVVLTHVPPFREACWYQGSTSGDDWLPFFVCRAAGEVLLKAIQSHPEARATVLCGHTHGAGEAQLLPNLQVHTGGADYGSPRMQRIIEVP
jgi:3',5'-cyclic AMP phosphodiesterase CpdA